MRECCDQRIWCFLQQIYKKLSTSFITNKRSPYSQPLIGYYNFVPLKTLFYNHKSTKIQHFPTTCVSCVLTESIWGFFFMLCLSKEFLVVTSSGCNVPEKQRADKASSKLRWCRMLNITINMYFLFTCHIYTVLGSRKTGPLLWKAVWLFC